MSPDERNQQARAQAQASMREAYKEEAIRQQQAAQASKE